MFFWGWALKNTIQMTDNSLDLGVVSFGTVMVSSGYMLGVLTSGSLTSCPKRIKHATTGSHIFVALNYALGAVIGFTVLGRPGFSVYCIIFTFLWFGLAYYGHLVMHSVAMAGETLPLSA